jgi:chromate reductase, NAD(P)H dehydrogenase (quinone)
MTTKNTILIFAGGTRHSALHRQPVSAVAGLAQAEGATVTLLELADLDIPLHNADFEAKGTPADVLKLKQIMFDHPAWIICSPEYNGSHTALLKNTIDWASSPVKSDTA